MTTHKLFLRDVLQHNALRNTLWEFAQCAFQYFNRAALTDHLDTIAKIDMDICRIENNLSATISNCTIGTDIRRRAIFIENSGGVFHDIVQQVVLEIAFATGLDAASSADTPGGPALSGFILSFPPPPARPPTYQPKSSLDVNYDYAKDSEPVQLVEVEGPGGRALHRMDELPALIKQGYKVIGVPVSQKAPTKIKPTTSLVDKLYRDLQKHLSQGK